MNKFYLYRHVRNDIGTPFYIGIGSKKKNFTPNSEYKRAFYTCPGQRSRHWVNTFNASNCDITIDILYESDYYEEIISKEIEFIALYGRKDLGNGPLVNFTDGGDGVTGSIPSKETILKIKETKRKNKKPISIETRKKLSIISKNRIRTEEWKRKISESHKGKKMHPDTFIKLAEAIKSMKRGPLSEKTKQKISDTMKANFINKPKKGTPTSEETKQKLRIANLDRKRSKETIQKLRISHLGKKYPNRKRKEQTTG